MEKTLHILVVGNHPGLQSEFESALQGVSNYHFLTVYASTYHQAEQLARSRHPQLVCVEMNGDMGRLKTFTHDLSQFLPDTPIAGLYRHEQFDSDHAESQAILEGVRARIQDFLRHPLSSTDLRQLLDRLLTRRPSTGSLESRGPLIAFISNKGGVGKSTLSVNAACYLASRHPDQVLLVDASLQLGVCSIMLNLTPETTIVDVVREKERLDETLLRQMSVPHDCGLHLLAAPKDAMEAAEVDEESMYRILNLATRSFAYVIIDTFPMLDSTVMAVLDLCDMACVIMQGTAPNVIGMASLLPILDGVGVPLERQRLILNQNHQSFAGNLTPHDIEGRLGREFDHLFPYQKRILAAANIGEPYILRTTKYFGYGRAMVQLIQDIEGLSHPNHLDENQPL